MLSLKADHLETSGVMTTDISHLCVYIVPVDGRHPPTVLVSNLQCPSNEYDAVFPLEVCITRELFTAFSITKPLWDLSVLNNDQISTVEPEYV